MTGITGGARKTRMVKTPNMKTNRIMNAKWLLLFSFLVALTLLGRLFLNHRPIDTNVKPETPSPPPQASEQIQETHPSRDSITLLEETDQELFVSINGVKHRLTLANLSKAEMDQIVEVATSKDNPEFPLEGEDIPEIRSLQDAYTHFATRISMAATPRTFFTLDSDYYFSGGRSTADVDDFSEGYLVTKEGKILLW